MHRISSKIFKIRFAMNKICCVLMLYCFDWGFFFFFILPWIWNEQGVSTKQILWNINMKKFGLNITYLLSLVVDYLWIQKNNWIGPSVKTYCKVYFCPIFAIWSIFWLGLVFGNESDCPNFPYLQTCYGCGKVDYSPGCITGYHQA